MMGSLRSEERNRGLNTQKTLHARAGSVTCSTFQQDGVRYHFSMAVEPKETHEELIRTVYPQLRKMAARLLSRERDNHTLQRTALVHEAFIRLFGKRPTKDCFPQSFLGLAAHQMRQILIDYGRKHGAKKRGADFARVPLFDADCRLTRDEDSLLALNEALERLGEMDQRALSVVELKFFGGFTNAESAEILGVSDGTVEATWLHARLWLFRELTKPSPVASSKAEQGCLTESLQQA